MEMIQKSYRGVSLLVDLGFDRIMVPIALVVGLSFGALIGTELSGLAQPAQEQIR